MTSIRGTTTLVGLLGWPTAHSLSPRMQNAGFEALGLDWAYVPLATPPERLGEAVRGLVATGFAGANVTIPHKERVTVYCDELDNGVADASCVDTRRCGNGVPEPGEACDDGNNTDGDCWSATCTAEPSGQACATDGNVCTDDVCDGSGSCGHPYNTAPCDDGNFCNGTDTCSGGACAHSGDPCASGGECADSCNEATDSCFDPAATACGDDGNSCTSDECDGRRIRSA